jgi:hypothetical protein
VQVNIAYRIQHLKTDSEFELHAQLANTIQTTSIEVVGAMTVAKELTVMMWVSKYVLHALQGHSVPWPERHLVALVKQANTRTCPQAQPASHVQVASIQNFSRLLLAQIVELENTQLRLMEAC